MQVQNELKMFPDWVSYSINVRVYKLFNVRQSLRVLLGTTLPFCFVCVKGHKLYEKLLRKGGINKIALTWNRSCLKILKKEKHEFHLQKKGEFLLNL